MSSYVVGLRGQRVVQTSCHSNGQHQQQSFFQESTPPRRADVSGFSKLLELRTACIESHNIESNLSHPNPFVWRLGRQMESHARQSPKAREFGGVTPSSTFQEHIDLRKTSCEYGSVQATTVGAQKPTTSPTNASSSGRQICWQYRENGKCSRGAECRFLHIADVNDLKCPSTKETHRPNSCVDSPTGMISLEQSLLEAFSTRQPASLEESRYTSCNFYEAIETTPSDSNESCIPPGRDGSVILSQSVRSCLNHDVELGETACAATTPSNHMINQRKGLRNKSVESKAEVVAGRQSHKFRALPKIPQPYPRRHMVAWREAAASSVDQAKLVTRTKESLRLLCYEMSKLKEVCHLDDTQFCEDVAALSQGISHMRRKNNRRRNFSGHSMSTMSTTAGTPMRSVVAPRSADSPGTSTVSSPIWVARPPAHQDICDAIIAIVEDL